MLDRRDDAGCGMPPGTAAPYDGRQRKGADVGRTTRFEHRLPAGAVFRVVQGDLTEEPVDAIVNAANTRLQHGGGVAGAIVRKGGRGIQEESDRWVAAHGEVATGTAAVTAAGALAARWVIHAVGPVWGSGDEVAKLAGAVRSALDLAAAKKARSLSLPAISTGIYGFPKELAAETIVEAIESWLASHPGVEPREVNLTNWDEPTAAVMEAVARRRWGG